MALEPSLHRAALASLKTALTLAGSARQLASDLDNTDLTQKLIDVQTTLLGAHTQMLEMRDDRQAKAPPRVSQTGQNHKAI